MSDLSYVSRRIHFVKEAARQCRSAERRAALQAPTGVALYRVLLEVFRRQQ